MTQVDDFVNVTLLALLQGVAEFLPISSSGHLVIGQHLLGIREAGMRLDVFLHAGTLISVMVFYRKTILRLLLGKEWALLLKIFVSSLPAVAVYFAFRERIDAMFENARMVGALLMFTGGILAGTRFIPKGKKDVSFLRALWMGAMQAVALLPGVSRSGMTLAAARAGAVDPEKSAEFSFLMSMPLILGGVLFEVIEMFGGNAVGQDGGIGWTELLWGMSLASVVGYVSLAVLIKALKGRWFWLFGPYCFAAGLATVWFL